MGTNPMINEIFSCSPHSLWYINSKQIYAALKESAPPLPTGVQKNKMYTFSTEMTSIGFYRQFPQAANSRHNGHNHGKRTVMRINVFLYDHILWNFLLRDVVDSWLFDTFMAEVASIFQGWISRVMGITRESDFQI